MSGLVYVSPAWAHWFCNLQHLGFVSFCADLISMIFCFCFWNWCRNVFVRILRRRSTEEFESVPYVSKLLNAYFWVYYGLIKPNSVLVATVNIFGAVVEIVFLTIFLLFAPPRMKVSFIYFYHTKYLGLISVQVALALICFMMVYDLRPGLPCLL